MRLAKVIENFVKQTCLLQFYYYLAYHFTKKSRESYTISNIHMLHQQVIETKIGNAMRSLSVSQIPPSHQSKDKPCLRTHYAHEPLPRDIPPSTVR